MTGSINQYGDVQAVGGINEKIEGFFHLCQARQSGLGHAMIIPKSNVRNLMLKQEVVDAVAQGAFSIYAVQHVDQALELLTGQPAGCVDQNGNYPENSVNGKAISRLQEIAAIATEKEDREHP